MAEKFKPGNENEAFMLPVDREMNSDRVLFGSISYTLQFCGCKVGIFHTYLEFR